MAKCLIMFGPPGAGKGTQAETLADAFGMEHLSTGEMMRAARAEGTAIGKEFDSYMSKGQLVPDELVLQLIESKIEALGPDVGAVFDGYPRTLPQAQALDTMLGRTQRPLEKVIELEVSLEEIIARIAGRLTCQRCGQAQQVRYSVAPSGPRCSRCGSTDLVRRQDDSEDVARQRYSEYKRKTEPVLAYYKERDLVVSVNVIGSVEEVHRRVMQAVQAPAKDNDDGRGRRERRITKTYGA
jgi:adenylate kinase